MSEIFGQCFCGEIKYKFNGPVKPATSCHCSSCRKAFSGSGSAMSPVADSSFQWLRGEALLKTYIGKKGAGLGFCGQCGTTLIGIFNEKISGVALGTLNDDPEVLISQHIFVGSKACWDNIGGETPQFAEWPPKG
ncbi:MAG: GFA family protein [SAR324 cluster bacterium]|nr:GFA family protein [SAR324 cluster bacterium]